MIGELECPHWKLGSKNHPLSRTPVIGAPQLLAVHVPGNQQSDRSECGHDAPAVRRRSGVCLRRFGVPFDFRRAGKCRSFPYDFSGRLIERVHLPLVLGQIVNRLHVAIQSGPKALVAGLADGRRDENAIAPGDWARVCDARYRRLPLDVLPARDVPLGYSALTVAVAAAGVASEGRPVSGCDRCNGCNGCDGCGGCGGATAVRQVR